MHFDHWFTDQSPNSIRIHDKMEKMLFELIPDLPSNEILAIYQHINDYINDWAKSHDLENMKNDFIKSCLIGEFSRFKIKNFDLVKESWDEYLVSEVMNK